MRLDEFYNPETDNNEVRQTDDTRKPVLTLEKLNKLRKIRAIKAAEETEHKKFVKVMYAAPADDAGI
jgi:hypothetical protein